MKRHLSFILMLVFLLGIPTISRAEYKSVDTGVNRQTWFNSVTDSLATIGKSKAEKAAIKKQRHMARTTARLQKLKEQRHKRIIQR